MRVSDSDLDALGIFSDAQLTIVNKWDEPSCAFDPVADILAALERSKADPVPEYEPQHMIVPPGVMRRWVWFHEVVMPRLIRGEYVPADEWDPPVTAAEIRGRMGR